MKVREELNERVIGNRVAVPSPEDGAWVELGDIAREESGTDCPGKSEEDFDGGKPADDGELERLEVAVAKEPCLPIPSAAVEVPNP
jgi:hypothetical protein